MNYLKINQYDRWATLQILETLDQDPSHIEVNDLIHHNLEASQVWHSRLIGVQGIWNDQYDVSLFRPRVEEIYTKYQTYIRSVHNDSTPQNISFQNLKGESFSTNSADILQHVFNHATHHRAQILLYWRQLGIARPPLDYFFYCRQGISE